jgi:hypothetical protein
MDLQLVGLIALIAAVLYLGTKHSTTLPGKPGAQYQRAIGAAATGLFALFSGLVGWDISHSHGWFRGTKWVDGPVWWQVGLGLGLLLLAGFLARRVSLHPEHRRPAHR